jgi:ATP-binding cassette subfamily B protein
MPKEALSEQFSALRHLPRFFRMIWATNKYMTIGNMALRFIKAGIPLATLWVGKEIIDEVIRLIDAQDGSTQYLWTMVGLELGLVILSDLINRVITLLDSLLGDLFANKTSVELIRHAAILDLYQFENPNFYDKLERARRQTNGRTVLMSLVLSQLQDIITILFLGVGLIAFNPWLILLLIIAVIPSFLGESHFNQRTYSLTRSWTPERRELDYIRYIGASDATAKEVKTFNLSDFLARRFETLADRYYKANKKIAVSRAGWGIFLSAIGSLAYYGAYVFIIIQTISSLITVGTLTFLAGSFSRMQSMLQSIMSRFSRITESALYLQDLFDFFELKPQIASGPNSQPFPKSFSRVLPLKT